jgi:hypothetical protein
MADAQAIERAYQVHLKEYEVLRDEILLFISHQNQLMSYAIAIITGTATLFVIGQPSVANQQPFLLLVASLLMSAISWAAMEASLSMEDISLYIQKTLIPKIQCLVGDESRFEFQLLKWEGTHIDWSARSYFRVITSSGKAAISYVSSVLFIVAYVFLQPLYIGSWPITDKILFTLAIIVSLVVPLGALLNLLTSRRMRFKSFGLRGRKKL